MRLVLECLAVILSAVLWRDAKRKDVDAQRKLDSAATFRAGKCADCVERRRTRMVPL